MKNMKLGLLFTTAALAFATGCGDIVGGSDGGSEGAACTSDDNCATGLACHPGLNECRYTCTGDSECPTSEKHCGPISSDADAGTSASFCGCTPLADNSLCATADSTTPYCNYQTHTCSASQGTPPGPLACTGTLTNNQPDVCGYGSWCSDADQHCAALTAGSCSNVSAFSSWGSSSTGPVIYKIKDLSEAGLDPCGNPSDVRYDVLIYAYAGGDLTEWPASRTNLPGGGYYNSSGAMTAFNGGNIIVANGYTSWNDGSAGGITDHKVATFHVTACGAAGTTSIELAYAFTNGNGVCFTATHN